jgi:tetratricopeptide (TPR) repeat protein
MDAPRLAALAGLALVAGLCFPVPAEVLAHPLRCSSEAGSQSSSPAAADRAQAESAQTDPEQTQPAGSTSSPIVDQKTVHQKTGPYSSKSVRHTRVAEEGAPPPELTQAEDAIQKHNYAAAEPLLQKVVEHDPANYVAWFDLGFTENGLGKLDDSIAAYRKSVAVKPDAFEPNLNLGLQLAKSGHPEAERFLRSATQLKPSSNVSEGKFRAWLSLANVLEKSNREEALTAYHQAATLQPKDAEPHLAAGHLLEQDNKFADAEQEYKQALALDPASDALTGLANVYMRGRRFAEAEEYLRKLVAAHPREAAAHIQLGRVLAAQGKNDEAIAELQTVAKPAAADVSVQRDLADLYFAAAKNEEAETAYRALLATHPNEAELHHDLGRTLLRQKKFQEAQKEFLATVRLKPDLGEAYSDLAFAANENKDYSLSVKALDARAKLVPEVPFTYFLRASALDHLHDYKQAAVNYHLFLSTANGKYPDQEWQAKHRLIAIEPKK